MATTEDAVSLAEPLAPASPVGADPALAPDIQEAATSPETTKDKTTSSPRQKQGAAHPRRPLVSSTTKRPIGSTQPTATKTTSTATRAPTGSTLSKPPTRPAVGSTVRKSALTTGTGQIATTTHRPRISVGSSADEKSKVIPSSGDEIKKPGTAATAKRTSLSGTTLSKTPATSAPTAADRRSTITPAASDRKPTTGRSVALSPPKSSPRPPAIPVAPAKTMTPGATTRTSRPVTTSTDSKKRPGHVPVSPVAKKESGGHGAAAFGKALTSRSAVLQQRIKEHEAIMEKLQAAIAADEAGDEAKRDQIQGDLANDISSLKASLGMVKESEETADSGKLSELKSQLAESEAKVVELQKELEDVLAKMKDFEKSAEEESEKVESAATAIRAEHAAKIEQMSVVHAEYEGKLRAQISEAESRASEALKHSVQEIEDAKKNIMEEAEMKTSELKKQKAAQDATLEKLQNDLISEKSTVADLAGKIDALNDTITAQTAELSDAKNQANERENKLQSELRGRDSVMDSLKSELQRREQEVLAEHTRKLAEKENEIENFRKIIEELQDGMRELHESESNEHERAIASMKAEHDSAIANLSATHSQQLAKAHEEMESSRQLLSQEIQTHKATAADRDNTIAKLLASKTQLEETVTKTNAEHQSEMQSLKEKFDASEQKIKSLETNLEAERDQVAGLQKSVEALEEASKGKDEHYEMMKKKSNAETAAAEERHSEEVEDLKEKLSVSHKAIRELQDKYDELAASKTTLEEERERDLESWKAEMAAIHQNYTDQIAALSESHSHARKEFEDTHAKDQRDLEEFKSGKHAIEADYTRTIEELRAAHNEIASQKAELESSVEKLAKAKQGYSSDLADLNKQLVEAKHAAADTSALDNLRTELVKKHTELSNLQQEKGDLVETLNTALADSKKSKSELDKVKEQLTLAEHQLEQQKEVNDKTMTDVETWKSTAASSEDKRNELEADLASLKSDIDTLTEENIALGTKNIALVEQVHEAEAKSNKRIRELELDLAKKSDSPNGAHVTRSGGLQESKWAVAEEDGVPGEKNRDLVSKGLEEAEGPTGVEGEDLGSSIEGTMASIQEQLRQIKDVNDDMHDSNVRSLKIVNMLSDATQASSHPSPFISPPREAPTNSISNTDSHAHEIVPEDVEIQPS